MQFTIAIVTEAIGIPGMLVYRQTREEAAIRVQALALRVLADKLEHKRMTLI